MRATNYNKPHKLVITVKAVCNSHCSLKVSFTVKVKISVGVTHCFHWQVLTVITVTFFHVITIQMSN